MKFSLIVILKYMWIYVNRKGKCSVDWFWRRYQRVSSLIFNAHSWMPLNQIDPPLFQARGWPWSPCLDDTLMTSDIAFVSLFIYLFQIQIANIKLHLLFLVKSLGESNNAQQNTHWKTFTEMYFIWLRTGCDILIQS